MTYRYYINGNRVDPIYNSDLALEENIESGQRFFRKGLSGKLTFVNGDYDYLNNSPFDTIFHLTIESDGSGTFSTYFMGKFSKTDCSWDADNKIVECTINSDDDYEAVLAGLDKEYDLIKLAPEIVSVDYDRRPLIQLYVAGASVVSNFLGGTYWEQEVTEPVTDGSILSNTYHFAIASSVQEVQISKVQGDNPAVYGTYAGKGGTLLKDTGLYKLYYNGTKYQLIRVSDNLVMYETGDCSLIWSGDILMERVDGVTGQVMGYGTSTVILGRYLLSVDTYNGSPTYEIPLQDIVATQFNYTRCIEYNIDVVDITATYSTTPSEYGLMEAGKYFIPPYNFYGSRYFPIAKSSWLKSSIWFQFYVFDYILEEKGRAPHTLKDAYPLYSVINVLLAQFSDIVHSNTVEYSEFLYAPNNPLTGYGFTLMITPKTNVTKGDYDTPAQTAMITLNQVLSMLRDCFRCYWYIENGKLRIEHTYWYDKGLSYIPSTNVGVDLTSLVNHRVGKTWDFGKNKFTFDKQDLVERYEFSWMEDCSEAFMGYPIDIKSNYVTKGNKEQVSISNFNPDVDFVMVNTDAVSEDGFVLMAAKLNTTNIFSPTASDKMLSATLNPTNGNTTSNVLYNTSGYMPVKENVYYTLNYKSNLVWYDSDKLFISGSSATSPDTTLLAPAGAAYCRCDALVGYWNAFTFMRGKTLSGYWYLPYIQRTVRGADLYLQNGILSWIYLHPNFYIYDLPAKSVEINGEAWEGYIDVKKKKKQEVKFPCDTDPDPFLLVKTGLGDGQIEKMSINLSSRLCTATLKYDTE